MKPKLIIFPFNGNGIEAFDCIGQQYELIGYADDTPEKQGKYQYFEVFSRDIIHKYSEAKVLAVIGSPQNYLIRKQIIDSLSLPTHRFASLVHPQASISKLASIGYNTLIMSGVVITSNAQLGNHICVLPNTVIHHDVLIDDYTMVGSNVTIAGGIKIEANAYVGSGTSIIQGITVGEGSMIGMGTTVIRNVDSNSKIVGNPARSIK